MDFYRKLGIIFISSVLALLVALSNGAGALADDYQCTGTVLSETLDNVTVPQNETCTLTGAIVGNIFVESNATLHAHNVQVNGNIQADNAARVNVYTGSSVEGDIQIFDSGAAEIEGVDIVSNLQLEGNDQLLQADNNNIGGDLQAFDNTGGVAITGNTIDGNLQCEGNSPAPTGSGNAVHGDMEDQCANFGGEPPPDPTNTPPQPTGTSAPTQTPPAPTLTPTPTQMPPGPTPMPTHTAPAPTVAALLANEDVYTLAERQMYVPAPGILHNDQVPGGDPVEVILIHPPQFGTLTLGQNGDFSYEVQEGYFGEDTFEYALRSDGVQAAPVIVRIVMVDQTAPDVLWISPVPAGGRHDMNSGEQAVLEADASDNFGLEKVTFWRWDYEKRLYIILAELTQPPYRVTFEGQALLPNWNQFFVSAKDLAGNESDFSPIWLYKLDQTQAVSEVFLPSLFFVK